MFRLVYTLFLALSAHAAGVSTPESARDGLMKFVSSIPGGARLGCLLNDYAAILDSESSGANARLKNFGLVNFVQGEFAKEPLAVQRATKAFYDEAATFLDHHGGTAAITLAKDQESPTLAERAGDANHPELKPGWLWDLAMKHAQGDPNLASSMIALCGHDDTAQEEVTVSIDAETAANDLAVRQKNIDDALATLTASGAQNTHSDSDACDTWVDGRLDGALYENENFGKEAAKIGGCTDAKRIPAIIKSLGAYRGKLKLSTFTHVPLHCPTGIPGELGYRPGFYLPENLGKGVDISSSLRKRIADSQAPFACSAHRSPTEKPDPYSCLPAKAYHVYGGEYVACEMIARGHNPALVVELSAALGWYYRGFYLTSIARDCADDLNSPDDPPTPKKVSGWLDLLAELKHLGRRTSCTSADLVDYSPEDFFVACDRPTKDALFLLRQWTILGAPGKFLGPLVPNLGAGEVRPENRPASWSDERFQLAKAKVKQIYTDFEWTMEQHRAGAKFAQEHCKPDPKKQARKTCN
jgi:hypothetical protein